MNENNDPPSEPEDLSSGDNYQSSDDNWNFRNADASDKRQGSGRQHAEKLTDVFDSLEDSDPPAFATDEERMSELQRQVKEKRRVALAGSETARQRYQDKREREQEKEAEESEQASTKDDESSKKKGTSFKLMETILIGAFLAIIGVGLLWTLKETLSFPRDQSGIRPAATPIQGQHAVIESLRDFWREPITSGENPDRPSLGTKLIPVIEITLGEGSKSGILRFFFRDPAGELVGDPRAVEFEDGRFTENGSPTIQVSSTTGFTDASNYNRYRYEDLEFWQVEVREGLPGQDAGEFQQLFIHDISAKLKGKLSLDLYE